MTQSVGGGGPFGTILKWHHCVIGVWQNVAIDKRVQQIHLIKIMIFLPKRVILSAN
jgi:hypothetical protein